MVQLHNCDALNDGRSDRGVIETSFTAEGRQDIGKAFRLIDHFYTVGRREHGLKLVLLLSKFIHHCSKTQTDLQNGR